MHDPEDERSEEPSRSQRKRDALQVFDLGEALVALDDGALARIPMPEDLRELVRESRRVSSLIARKRQLQFLAKQMRRQEEALPAIEQALQAHSAQHRGESAQLHRIERWRERLIHEGDEALEALLAEFPDADRQQLRTLARRASQELKGNKPPTAARALFKALRELVEAG
jgi:ribosome-associated protein